MRIRRRDRVYMCESVKLTEVVKFRYPILSNELGYCRISLAHPAQHEQMVLHLNERNSTI